MREIKFRAWDKENKEMLDVQELDYEDSYDGQPMIRTTKYSDYFDTEEMLLMQYTGLKDKNGKEIYEGDIVAIQFQRATKTKNALIEYSEKYAAFIITHTKEIKHENENLGDYQMQNFEVIGNIYDNPELLEEGE